MEIVLKTIKEHRAENVDPANPKLFVTTETQYALPNKGQVVHTILSHGMDAQGRRLDELSLPIRSGISNEIIQAQSAAQCARCYQFIDRKLVAKYLPPEKMQGIFLRDPSTQTNFVVPLGYCRRCWFRFKIWEYLLNGCLWLISLPFVFLLRPIVAIHEAEPKPDYTPHPRTDPSMMNLSTTSPEATNEK